MEDQGLGQAPNMGVGGNTEVGQTMLQPQVDTEDLANRAKDDDAIGAIDQLLGQFEEAIQGLSGRETETVARFQQLWQEFKTKWQQVKSKSGETPEGRDFGLGSADVPERDMMQQNPNMVPVQAGGGSYNGPNPPAGIFGVG